MKATPINQKLYWDNRARSYPRPFDPATLRKTRRMLKLLRGLGVDFAGKSVLDIGCGTGVYALPLARRAAQITGLDSSKAMLQVFRNTARTRGIANARAMQTSWSGLRTVPRADIAFASMTAAVRTAADLRKMERACGEVCVYIGWAGVRRNALLSRVYAHHGVTYAAPEGAERVLKALKAMGRKPRTLYIADGWYKHASVAETLRDLEVSIKVNGGRFDREWTMRLLRKKARDGVVRQLTKVRKAVLVWRPKKKGG